jgi:hypothetical protein|uniref:Translation initiation factor 5A C-terminal domain-containing protein n=1 Tax=Globisporangium ultimum (strain ATCC 200006 / CBS 805.95 / DAOM BR144) TaxID=431595 RepID=K3WRB8_GLOUD
MDSRCIKFWEDGQELLKNAANAARLAHAMGKILKELRTMSRFLQKNQASRFSDNAQQKLVDAVAFYVTFSKQRVPIQSGDDQQLVEAVFQVIKDGLAMPFNVMGTKQKKRLMKWYNELIGVVGGDPDALALDGVDSAPKRMEWSVLGIDDDGYLSLMDESNGDTCETFQVKKSKEFKQIQKGLETTDVTVVTMGEDIVEIQVADGDAEE